MKINLNHFCILQKKKKRIVRFLPSNEWIPMQGWCHRVCNCHCRVFPSVDSVRTRYAACTTHREKHPERWLCLWAVNLTRNSWLETQPVGCHRSSIQTFCVTISMTIYPSASAMTTTTMMLVYWPKHRLHYLKCYHWADCVHVDLVLPQSDDSKWCAVEPKCWHCLLDWVKLVSFNMHSNGKSKKKNTTKCGTYFAWYRIRYRFLIDH